MILFKKESKEKILAGEKWQTRKLWARPRVKTGSMQLFYLRLPATGEKPFARARIIRVWSQRLGEMGEEEAHAEGYATIQDFLQAFQAINRRRVTGELRDVQVYAVEFRLLEKMA